MTSVEAASSLFGDSADGLDFFGTPQSPTAPSHQPIDSTFELSDDNTVPDAGEHDTLASIWDQPSDTADDAAGLTSAAELPPVEAGYPFEQTEQSYTPQSHYPPAPLEQTPTTVAYTSGSPEPSYVPQNTYVPAAVEFPPAPAAPTFEQHERPYVPENPYAPLQPEHNYSKQPGNASWYSQPPSLPAVQPVAAPPVQAAYPQTRQNPYNPYNPYAAQQPVSNSPVYASTVRPPQPSGPLPPRPVSQSIEMYRPSSKSAYDPPAFTKRASTLSLRRDAGRFTPPAFPQSNSSPHGLPPSRSIAPPIHPPSQTYGRVVSMPDFHGPPNHNVPPPVTTQHLPPPPSHPPRAAPQEIPAPAKPYGVDFGSTHNNGILDTGKSIKPEHEGPSSHYAPYGAGAVLEEDPESLFGGGEGDYPSVNDSDDKTPEERHYTFSRETNKPATDTIDDALSSRGSPNGIEGYTPRMRASTDSARSLISAPYDPYAPPPSRVPQSSTEAVNHPLTQRPSSTRVDGLPATALSATALRDPYAPPAPSYGGGRTSRSSARAVSYAISKPPPVVPVDTTPYFSDVLPPVEDLRPDLNSHLNQNQYAPSPSLLGTNDPLSRHSSRVPVFSFGFGGRVVSCFHLSQVSTGGFDIAMSSQETKQVRLRILKDLIPATTLDESTSEAAYPGPLFGDSGSASTSLIGTGTATVVKTKKAQVVAYLQERADEAEKGLGHLVMGSLERQKAEGRLALFQLLRILVENDGSFSGSVAEAAVRQVLGSAVGSSSTFTNSAAPSYLEQPISVTTLRSSSLLTLERFLVAGERRQAYQFAMSEKLWAHALAIAHGVDKEAWNEVLHEFIHAELGTSQVTNDSNSSRFDGLKVAYGLLGGLGASSIQQLVPQAVNGVISHSNHPAQATPVTPNFVPPVQGTALLADTLAQWPTMASISFGSSSPGSSAALTALGDHLTSQGWTEAAHCCYLLSPHTSSLGGAGMASSRAVLLGLSNPLSIGSFHKLPDPIILTEIAEFALSLATSNKVQEPFAGLAHLQAYRLIRAYQLADLGHTSTATRYCEAIGASLRLNTRGSSLYTQPLLEHLKELSDRLTGAPHQSMNKSWGIGKVAKPSLDNLGGWLEGRIKNFIVGDGENEASQESSNTTKAENHTSTGPFASYSTISSAQTSQCPSPSPSIQNLSTAASYPAPRPASIVHGTLRPPNRPPSTASEFAQSYRTTSPAIRNNPPAVTSHGPYTQEPESMTVRSIPAPDSAGSSTSPYWSGSQEGSSGRTPTATTFRGDRSPTWPNSAAQAQVKTEDPRPPNGRYIEEEGDDDDELGLGNAKPRRKGEVEQDDAKEEAKPLEKQTPPKSESRPAETQQSGSWFGWIWKPKDTSSPAPVKAKLGEESSFYYDKDLKRWVNKKAGAEPPKPAPPPPPPRHSTAPPPETAPPTKSQFSDIGMPSTSAPPTRPISADVGAPPLRSSGLRSNLGPPPSNLGPPPSNLGPPPSASGDSSGPPSRASSTAPPSRPKSNMSGKRNVRSRYVDVFQQQQEGG